MGKTVPFRRSDDDEPKGPFRPRPLSPPRREPEEPYEPPSGSPLFDRATAVGIQCFVWGLIVGIGIVTLVLLLH